MSSYSEVRFIFPGQDVPRQAPSQPHPCDQPRQGGALPEEEPQSHRGQVAPGCTSRRRHSRGLPPEEGAYLVRAAGEREINSAALKRVEYK